MENPGTPPPATLNPLLAVAVGSGAFPGRATGR